MEYIQNFTKPCVLCGQTSTGYKDEFRFYHHTCEQCGDFAVHRDVIDDLLGTLSDDQKRHLSACTRERKIHGLGKYYLWLGSPKGENIPPNSYTVEYILSRVFPSRMQDRLDKVLGNLCALSSTPGQEVELSYATDLPVLFAESREAGRFVLDELEDAGYIHTSATSDSLDAIVRGRGIARMQELEQEAGRLESSQAFVAMWFDPSMNDAFDLGIGPALEDCGFTAIRVDRTDHANKICDEVVAQIRKSRFIVVDVTDQRQAVYFEAGFALGLDIPIIWTCRDDKDLKLCFDTRQYPHILWLTPDDLRQQLTHRVRALVPGAKR